MHAHHLPYIEEILTKKGQSANPIKAPTITSQAALILYFNKTINPTRAIITVMGSIKAALEISRGHPNHQSQCGKIHPFEETCKSFRSPDFSDKSNQDDHNDMGGQEHPGCCQKRTLKSTQQKPINVAVVARGPGVTRPTAIASTI